MSLLEYLESDTIDFDQLVDDQADQLNSISRHGEHLSADNLSSKIFNTLPIKSKSNSKWARNAFNDWLKSRNEKILNSGATDLMFLSSEGHGDLSSLSRDQLNEAMQYFVFEVRKTDGTRYPSNTLRQLVVGINYWLQNFQGKPWRILQDAEFLGKLVRSFKYCF